MKPKILIVDDSSLARRTLRQALEDLGYLVEDVSDGPQAIESFYLHRPDLVILDIVMHGMYGTEVLAKLLEIDPAARVLMLTADVQDSTSSQVRQNGAIGILNKPITREKLAAALKPIFEGGTLWT
ncbi:MAG: response regulator [Verrucomicrobiales bacterium]|nr:response regulator [Verrucomicrobiales bacterium]